MSTAIPLPTKITIDNPKSVKAKTLYAQYGDGFMQAAGNGLNRKVREYDIEWGPLTLAEKDTVEASLDLVEGFGTLTWTPCNEVTELKFYVPDGKYDTTPLNNNGMYKITTHIIQRFD
jgi:phage-related protein